MARHSITDIFSFESNAVDLNGWTTREWDRRGVAGWDPVLQTYFMQLDVANVDLPVWWFGRGPLGLPTPQDMQLVLRAIFGRNGDGAAFPFKPGMLDALKAERDATLDASLLSDVQGADALFDTDEVARVTDDWVERTVGRGTPRKVAA